MNEKPEFGSETASRSVAENTGSGVDIGAAVAATDPDADAPFNTLTYTLTGDDAGYFDIVTTSGQLANQRRVGLGDQGQLYGYRLGKGQSE